MNPNAATLRLAVFPRSGLLADVALIVLGAALVSLAAQISIALPFTPVPITGQTFAVCLVGASLGAIRGTASLSLYVLAGIAGAPIYADGDHGWAQITGATGGYLLGFVLAAAVTGWLAEDRHWDRKFSSSIAAMLTGNVDHLPVRPAVARSGARPGQLLAEPRGHARVRAVPVRAG